MFPQKHIFLFTEDEPIYSLPFSFHFPFNSKMVSEITQSHFEITADNSKGNSPKCISLTETGISLMPALTALIAWGKEHFNEVVTD